MGYDPKKDKTLKKIKSKGKSLFFAEVKAYNGGEAKVQLRRQYESKDGELKDCSTGRLTMEDLKWLKKKLPKIIKAMEENTSKDSEK